MTHNNLVIHGGRQSTTTPPNHRRRWTPADAAWLRWEAETYIGDANYLHRLAARFGRTPHACRAALVRHYGWTYCGATGYLTMHQVAALLGVSAAALQRLVERGRFDPVAVHHNRPATYRISDDDLWTWMEDMRSWHIWQPERIAEPSWRSYFSELRRGWLSAAQAAALLGITPNALHRYRRDGRLPGVKPAPRAVWYPQRAVLDFRTVYRAAERL